MGYAKVIYYYITITDWVRRLMLLLCFTKCMSKIAIKHIILGVTADTIALCER